MERGGLLAKIPPRVPDSQTPSVMSLGTLSPPHPEGVSEEKREYLTPTHR